MKQTKTPMDLMSDSLKTFGEKSSDADSLLAGILIKELMKQSPQADSLQQDAVRRLRGAGWIGKQGEALVDSLRFDPSDTGPMFGENQTAYREMLLTVLDEVVYLENKVEA